MVFIMKVYCWDQFLSTGGTAVSVLEQLQGSGHAAGRLHGAEASVTLRSVEGRAQKSPDSGAIARGIPALCNL